MRINMRAFFLIQFGFFVLALLLCARAASSDTPTTADLLEKYGDPLSSPPERELGVLDLKGEKVTVSFTENESEWDIQFEVVTPLSQPRTSLSQELFEAWLLCQNGSIAKSNKQPVKLMGPVCMSCAGFGCHSLATVSLHKTPPRVECHTVVVRAGGRSYIFPLDPAAR
mgnify:CR=1 FL=1